MSLSVSFKPFERGEFLKISFLIKPHRTGGKDVKEFNIDDLAQIRFQFVQEPMRGYSDSDSTSSSDSDVPYTGTPCPILTSISIKKCESAKDLRVKLNVRFEACHYYEQLVCPDNWMEWIELGEITTKFEKHHSTSYKLITQEVSLIVSQAEVITFVKLYDDTITTDFNMTAKGGTTVVPMHRSCLLAHSDMFKTLFRSGDFIDKKDFQVGIADVTDQTIQHLKDYVYLGVLPNDGLRVLLLLAKCYLFENLKSECISKLVQTVTHEDLHSLISFACENNIPELVIALMQQTPQGIVHQAHLMHKKQDRKRNHSPEETDERKEKKKSKK